MRIPLFDNWVLTADSKQFIVCQMVMNEDGVEQRKDSTYHITFSGALSRAFQQRLLTCEAKTFEELLEIARETRDHLREIRNKVDKIP